MSQNKRYNRHTKLPTGLSHKSDLSTRISKLSKSDVLALSKMTGSTPEQIRNITQMMQDPQQLEKILNPNKVVTPADKMKQRAQLVEKLNAEQRFKNGSEQELKLVYAFMERLRTDPNLTEINKDKLRAMIILYNRLHGLGEKTPKMDEWTQYGIYPDEVLSKSSFQVTKAKEDIETEDLSELSD